MQQLLNSLLVTIYCQIEGQIILACDSAGHAIFHFVLGENFLESFRSCKLLHTGEVSQPLLVPEI